MHLAESYGSVLLLLLYQRSEAWKSLTQQMSWYGSPGGDYVLPIFLPQMPPHIRVQLQVQRLDLLPERRELLLAVNRLVIT